MPCVVPTQDYAYRIGDSITDEVLAILAEKHKIREPCPGRVVHESHPAGFVLRMQDDWEANTKKLRDVIRELVWTDHCANW